jgi:hypothetical protein
MQVKLYTGKEGRADTFVFFPESEEEMRIMGALRNAFFWGSFDNGTFPKYDGITSEQNFVTSMKFTIPANSLHYVKQGSVWNDWLPKAEYPEQHEALKALLDDIHATIEKINQITKRFSHDK